ncbi:unnamed protein product [Sphagnum balticum]
MSVMLLLIFGFAMRPTKGQLQYGYYDTTCPDAEEIARTALHLYFTTDLTSPASILRVSFHDCQVQGCDASIMLESGNGITSELESGSNFGIRRLDIIDGVKATLEKACPNTVSCADIIAMAGREAVAFTGGPRIDIPLGRRDSTFASAAEATASLPAATISVDQFIALFAGYGMTLSESVAILGAHTLGVGHCKSFANRLQAGSDPPLGPIFGAQLRTTCIGDGITNLAFVPNDLTNVVFDSQYFKDTNNGRGLFTIDAELPLDSRTALIEQTFANDEQAFFDAMISAYVKMTSSRVLTGDQGQIRQNCRMVNSS